LARKRKGLLGEVISKALYADDPSLYIVVYRDGDRLVEVLLPEFLELSGNFSVIPASRIVELRRGNRVLYRKRRLDSA
jgi:uncharacterized protein (UPF0248 family)